jgi:hypothetical protein
VPSSSRTGFILYEIIRSSGGGLAAISSSEATIRGKTPGFNHLSIESEATIEAAAGAANAMRRANGTPLRALNGEIPAWRGSVAVKLNSFIRPSAYTRAMTARGLPLVMAGAAAAGAGVFLWRRRGRAEGDESTAAEVEAHPS